MNTIIVHPSQFKEGIVPNSIVNCSNKKDKYNLKDFVKLLDEKFKYCGKTYTAKRFLSNDQRFYITSDNGFSFTKVYEQNSEGKFATLNKLYHQNNYNTYPIYTIEDAVEKLNKFLSSQ